jgi:hypothetical protein
MDIQKFLNAALKAREQSIDVPELAEWFGADEKPVWVVRGLTAAELGRANQAADKSGENLRALVAAMAGSGDKADAIRKTMGLSDEDVPTDVSRRIEMLAAGSVSPKIGSENRDVAVRLAESFPTVFYNLTNHILNLTGQGAESGKPKRSGQTPA